MYEMYIMWGPHRIPLALWFVLPFYPELHGVYTYPFTPEIYNFYYTCMYMTEKKPIDIYIPINVQCMESKMAVVMLS